VELLVLFIILRPLSYKASFGRAAAAMTLGGLWTVANLFLCMHCGSIGIAHTLWLGGVTIGLFVLYLVSVFRGNPPSAERAV
jgi:hypothetical protein